MEIRKYSPWEGLLIFILLGVEAWYLFLLPLCNEADLPLFMSGYLLLLWAYPLSKKQKINISKRETYLTIFMRWLVLNLAMSLFLFCLRGEDIKSDILLYTAVLTCAGGISLYLMLFIERLFIKWRRKEVVKNLFIYGKADERHYQKSETSILKELQTNKSMVYRFISAETEQGQLEETILQYDRVYVLDIPAERRNEFLKLCYKNKKPVYCISKLSDIMIQVGHTVKYEDKAFFCCEKYRLDRSEMIVKRAFDIAFSLIALVLLIPVFIVIAICIKLEDGGPVIYKQTRCTRANKEFKILKFRSMVMDAEPTGARLAEEHDARVTKVGTILRNTKLDELPQLVNILAGDMSVVGPRPERPELIQEIMKEVPEFEFRTYVKAGLTGYAQVQGNYNTLPLDKLKWDLMYINQYSFILDLKIILMTPFVIFMKNNREDV